MVQYRNHVFRCQGQTIHDFTPGRLIYQTPEFRPAIPNAYLVDLKVRQSLENLNPEILADFNVLNQLR